VTAGAVLLCSVSIGLLVGGSLNHAIARGFEGFGCLLLLLGFFIGNRGPLRLRDATAGMPFWGSRAVRWATEAERDEALNTSAVFVCVGLALVALGVVADERFSLF
jgi:hypothetical protein